jgi:DNA-binding transcriptional MerR regulator
MSDQIEKKFYTIGEVAEMIGEATSLIRFWEKEFTALKPHKTDRGTRKYSAKDIELIKYIHYLVKQKGYTLDGAKEALRKDQHTVSRAEVIAKLNDVKSFLTQLNQSI